jgi:hypothetical protein
MRIISTRTHGVIDYLTGLLLVAAPWLFGFANGGAAQWIPIIVGLAILGMSLMTDYELSVARVIPMPVHLGADAATGLLLIVSPWLFGFSGQVRWPHVVIGLFELAMVLMTDSRRTAGLAAGRA